MFDSILSEQIGQFRIVFWTIYDSWLSQSIVWFSMHVKESIVFVVTMNADRLWTRGKILDQETVHLVKQAVSYYLSSNSRAAYSRTRNVGLYWKIRPSYTHSLAQDKWLASALREPQLQTQSHLPLPHGQQKTFSWPTASSPRTMGQFLKKWAQPLHPG